MLSANAFQKCVVQNAQQAATVDADLRHVVPAVEAAQLAPDRLAETVGQDEFTRSNAGAVEFVEQPKACEFAHGVRQHIDADAELGQHWRTLVDLDVDTKL